MASEVDGAEEDFLCPPGEPAGRSGVSPLPTALQPALPRLFLGAPAPRWPAPGY